MVDGNVRINASKTQTVRTCCFEQEHCGKRPKDVHRGGLCGIYLRVYIFIQIRPVRQSAASGALYASYVKYNNNEKRIIKRT